MAKNEPIDGAAFAAEIEKQREPYKVYLDLALDWLALLGGDHSGEVKVLNGTAWALNTAPYEAAMANRLGSTEHIGAAMQMLQESIIASYMQLGYVETSLCDAWEWAHSLSHIINR